MMKNTMQQARKVDSRGRLLLGNEYADSLVTVENQEDGAVLIRLAAVVPAKEKWLFENETALNLVTLGLEQAKKRQFVKDPRKRADEEWIDKLKED